MSQDVKRGYAVCYVLVELAPEFARKLPRYPSIPAVTIGWLGRDLAFQGQSGDAAAAAFCVAHQFQAFQSRPLSFLLTMKTASSLLPA